MTVYIALLQGVNVGKHKRISMTDLTLIVSGLGGKHPVIVANSGNVVFACEGGSGAERLRAALEKAISDHVGMPVPTIIRTAAELGLVVDRNPYPDVADSTCLHVEFLLQDVPDTLAGIDFGNDHLTAHGREIYLHLPNRMSGITYDAKTLSKRLGTHHTSRNWNTITKLMDVADHID